MFGNGGTVFFGRIPFITVPVIIGILFVETVHIIITIRFGQNRCSSYRKVFSVAFDYRGMRDTGIFIEPVSVNEQVFGTGGQLIDSTMHGQERSTQEKGTGEKEASIWEHWENLKQKMTLLHPFEGENITCVHMELRDLRELPQKYWCLGNNSFLLHGYYNYRYLILARLGKSGERGRYILGVPGHYGNNEKYMAAMFGFDRFVRSTRQPPRDSRFGYWYTDLNFT